ncbi:MAG: putative membrane protein insertion efficiency factor [Phycisphaerae bacterium]|nr:MAG: putative membrane protein insertion efficiency factor [Phycisphaerae bacterium]
MIIVMSWLLIQVVRLYRITLGPFIGGHCRFYPSCSQYAIDALNKYGLCKAGYKIGKRLCRCHPWGGQGYDPA